MAPVTWECPQRCGYESDQEGLCPQCFLLLVPVVPPARPRYAINFPWPQIEEIPADGLEIGRRAPRFQDRADVQTYRQVGRHHARISWTSDGTLYIEDLGSPNGTFVDDQRMVAGQCKPVRPGQALRLAQDVVLELVELNQFGEPLW